MQNSTTHDGKQAGRNTSTEPVSEEGARPSLMWVYPLLAACDMIAHRSGKYRIAVICDLASRHVERFCKGFCFPRIKAKNTHCIRFLPSNNIGFFIFFLLHTRMVSIRVHWGSIVFCLCSKDCDCLMAPYNYVKIWPRSLEIFDTIVIEQEFNIKSVFNYKTKQLFQNKVKSMQRVPMRRDRFMPILGANLSLPMNQKHLTKPNWCEIHTSMYVR